MPLHASARAFLDAMSAFPQPYDVPLAQFRRAAAALVPDTGPIPLAAVEDRVIQGGDGQELCVRVYVPEADGPHPVIVWAHGGSFVRGDLETFDAGRRAFARATGAIIVAVDQRLSPETRFPGPLEDLYAAVRWAHAHIAPYGGDPLRLGVAGESSGGNLAAAAALLARDRGALALAFQLLVCPLLDATCRSPSIEALAEGYLLTKRQLLWAYDQYALGVDRNDPLLSPLASPDLSGLPPAVVVTIEFDPVRDEGELYAQRLSRAGVPVHSARIEGMVHHFPGSEAAETLVGLTRELDAFRRSGEVA